MRRATHTQPVAQVGYLVAASAVRGPLVAARWPPESLLLPGPNSNGPGKSTQVCMILRERSPALQESGHQVVCPSHLTELPPCSIRVTLPSRPQWPVYPSHWACRAPFLRVCSRIARSGILPRRGGPGRCLGDASFCQALFRPWLMVALRQGEPGEADLPARCCRRSAAAFCGITELLPTSSDLFLTDAVIKYSLQ